MPVKQKQIIPTDLHLNEETVQKLCGTGLVNKSETLGNRAAQLLEQVADGGMVLNSMEIAEIRMLSEKNVQTPREVVSLVAKAANRDNAAYTFHISLDPAYIEPLNQRAKEMGLKPEELMNQTIEMVLTNGWVQNIVPQGRTVYLNEEEDAAVRNALGKGHYIGKDIAELARKRTKAA